jgi:hypothetical protein
LLDCRRMTHMFIVWFLDNSYFSDKYKGQKIKVLDDNGLTMNTETFV